MNVVSDEEQTSTKLPALNMIATTIDVPTGKLKRTGLSIDEELKSDEISANELKSNGLSLDDNIVSDEELNNTELSLKSSNRISMTEVPDEDVLDEGHNQHYSLAQVPDEEPNSTQSSSESCIITTPQVTEEQKLTPTETLTGKATKFCVEEALLDSELSMNVISDEEQTSTKLPALNMIATTTDVPTGKLKRIELSMDEELKSNEISANELKSNDLSLDDNIVSDEELNDTELSLKSSNRISMTEVPDEDVLDEGHNQLYSLTQVPDEEPNSTQSSSESCIITIPHVTEEQKLTPTETLTGKATKFYLCLLLEGVHLSFYLANYNFMALISMLTDDGLSLFPAVIITNVRDGAAAVLTIFFAWLANTCLGDNLTLIFSAVIYSGGMILWFYVGSFYLGLVVISIGQGVYGSYDKKEKGDNKIDVDKEDFDTDVEHGLNNNQNHESKNIAAAGDNHCASSSPTQLNTLWFILKKYRIPIIGSFIAISSGEIEPLFLTGLLLASFVFLTGKSCISLCDTHKSHDDNNSVDGDEEKDQNSKHRRLHYGHNMRLDNQLGYLNKAASNLSTMEDCSLDQIQQRSPCTVQQVEDTELFITNIRLSLVFLMYGVMSAVGDTFFVEQANQMNARIGHFEVPTQLFVLSSAAIRKLVNILCEWLINREDETPKKRFYGTLRVGLGMSFSIPCFGIASVVEAKRLKGDMCVLWLSPQLILVGVMDGLAVNGMECFFKQEMPATVGRSYGNVLAEGIVGIGKLIGVGWFCLFYYITKIGGKPGWFGKDIDESRLDYYYLVMVAFGIFSLIIYILVAYKCHHGLSVSVSVSEDPPTQPQQGFSSDGQVSRDSTSKRQNSLQVSRSLRRRPSMKVNKRMEFLN